MNGLVNWEAIQKMQNRNMPGGCLDTEQANEMWSRVARMYHFMAGLEREFTLNQVNAMRLDKDDSVIDIGCGIGRLTIPVAQKVNSVTALDVSDKMLDLCRENVRKKGLENVHFVQMDWNVLGSEGPAQHHDIAFASRSVGLKDIVKLNNSATKYAYLLSFAGYPSLRDTQMELLEGIRNIRKRKPDPVQEHMFGYNITFNLLYDLGIDPMIEVVDDGFERLYDSKDTAYEDLRQVTVEFGEDSDLTDKEEERFRQNVDQYLSVENGQVRFLRRTKTFVIGWKPIKFQDLGNT